MMMFAIFPLFALFFLWLFSDAVGGSVYRRTRKRRERVREADSSLVDLSEISSSHGREPVSTFKEFQVLVFRLAARNKGRLTLSDVIVETGLDLDAAEKLLDRMVDGSRVQIDVNDDGMIFYTFPEIISRSKLEEV
jgi:hypothetical protein